MVLRQEQVRVLRSAVILRASLLCTLAARPKPPTPGNNQKVGNSLARKTFN